MALFGVSFPRREVTIRGEGIYLRACQMRDYAEWAALREKSRAFLTPWEPTWSTDGLTRGAFRRRLQRYAADWRSDQGYSFFLFRVEDGALVGGIGLSNVRRGVAETGSLGYWVGERYARRGYMSDGLAVILGFAFGRLKLHRVEAATLPHNAPSRGLLTKIGFHEEGYAREYLCIDGRWQDHVLFAMLRQEWGGR
jgi:ribosomal-protein-alanine N-acetyltransferase